MERRFEDIEILKDEAARLRKEVETQGVRLTLAQAWIQFFQLAYDSLLHYGVNYKSLKEVQDDTVLDEAMNMPVTRARDTIVEYLGRCTSAIRAAIRRKNFTVH